MTATPFHPSPATRRNPAVFMLAERRLAAGLGRTNGGAVRLSKRFKPIANRRSVKALIAWLAGAGCALADETNAAVAPLLAPSLPDAGVSLIRMVGALALVLGLFLGGVWLYRNWQRLALQRGRAPKLNVVETRSLGGRHALYVVGYERERFLLASSPTGVSLLTHLPTAEVPDAVAESAPSNQKAAPSLSFAAMLTQTLKGK